MQPGDLITVRQDAHAVGREVLLWDQAPDGRHIVSGRATRGELLLFLGPGWPNTVRVFHPVHGIRFMHDTYAGVTLLPDRGPV
jgi:hypothetical protein